MFNIQPVVEILSGLVASSQLDMGQIDAAVDALEKIKSTIDLENDEVIDKVDEIQDYLEYLLIVDEPLLEEVKEELADLIKGLQAGLK